MKAEAEYWLSAEGVKFSLPLDDLAVDWSERYASRVNVRLGSELTRYLLGSANHYYGTDTRAVLHTALARALRAFMGGDVFVIEEEHHGRHSDSVDLSRTLGWFTAMYPLKLELTTPVITDQLHAIKTQLDAVPGNGVGYGVWKYLHNRDTAKPAMSEVRFNYLGQFDKELNSRLFTYCGRPAGGDCDPDNLMTAKLAFNILVVQKELHMEIVYNSTAHRHSTISSLADTFVKEVTLVLEHLQTKHPGLLPMSDLEIAGLDEEDLENLFR
jgi:non-ribosomal peptide synthase protein (TIGR01720 family)